MAKVKTNKIFESIEEAHWDVLMACSAVGLVLFGIVMVYSASGVIGQEKFNNKIGRAHV